MRKLCKGGDADGVEFRVSVCMVWFVGLSGGTMRIGDCEMDCMSRDCTQCPSFQGGACNYIIPQNLNSIQHEQISNKINRNHSATVLFLFSIWYTIVII